MISLNTLFKAELILNRIQAKIIITVVITIAIIAIVVMKDLRNCFNHVDTKLNAHLSMVGPGL